MSARLTARSLLRRASRRRFTVLSYHGVADSGVADDPRSLMIPRSRLLAQVEALSDAGFEFVTVTELVRRVGQGLGHGLVALTFDDALANAHETLLELAAANRPATVYVVSDWIGGMHPRVPDPAQARLMDESELRELVAVGAEVGVHTASHADLARLSTADCVTELKSAADRIGAVIGHAPTSAAYPFHRHDAPAREAVRSLGFAGAVAGPQHSSWPFAIAREPVLRTHGPLPFALKVAGFWTPLGGSAAGRAVRAVTRPGRRRLESHRSGR